MNLGPIISKDLNKPLIQSRNTNNFKAFTQLRKAKKVFATIHLSQSPNMLIEYRSHRFGAKNGGSQGSVMSFFDHHFQINHDRNQSSRKVQF